jgi:ribosomal protein L37E/AraC-like DNA-binding protein
MYDFDFLKNSAEANKQAVLLAKVRYNEQLAPFINSPFAQNVEARLRYASDHIDRIIDECCESVLGAEKDVVGPRLKEIVAKEVAVSQPQKRQVDEPLFDGKGTIPDSYDNRSAEDSVGNAVEQDILDKDVVLEDEILNPDAQVEADTPIGEGEVQYPKSSAAEDWDNEELTLCPECGEDTLMWDKKGNAHCSNCGYPEEKTSCFRCQTPTRLGSVCGECQDFLVKKATDFTWQDRYPDSEAMKRDKDANPNSAYFADKEAYIRIIRDYLKENMLDDALYFAQMGFPEGDPQQIVDMVRNETYDDFKFGAYGQPFNGDLASRWSQPPMATRDMLPQPGQLIQPTQPVQQTQQQMACPTCGFTGTAAQVQDHYQKMIAANDQAHLNAQPAAGNSPGTVASKHGADESFLEHDHNREERAEGNPVHKDSDEDTTDPAEKFNEVVQQIADRHAAKRYSQADDDEVSKIASRYGIDESQISDQLHIVAHFGDYIGFNGDIVNDDPDTTGLTAIDDQDLDGQVEAHEALVPLEIALKRTAHELGMDEKTVADRIQDSLGGTDLPAKYHASVEGKREFYLPDDSVNAGQDASQDTEQQPNTGQTQ